jgi:hypothetical protein
MSSRPHELAPFHPPPRSILATICRSAGILSVLAVAACSDEPTDLPGATPLECTGAIETRSLRIDQLAIPFDWSVAGADHDGDGDVDNQVANLFTALSLIDPALVGETTPRIQRRVDDDTIWVVSIEQCDGEARVSLARGEVDGAGVRVLETGTLPAAGPSEDGRIEARDGIALIPLGAMMDLADTGVAEWHATYPSLIRIELSAGEASGTIAGGLAPGYHDVVARGFLPYAQAGLDRDDPDIVNLVDPGVDGTLSIAELEASAAFETYLRADLDAGGDVLDPPTIPALDGEPESYSFGVTFHALDVESEKAAIAAA